MEKKSARIGVTLPEDLQELLEEDVDMTRLPMSLRIVKIVDLYYKMRRARLQNVDATKVNDEEQI